MNGRGSGSFKGTAAYYARYRPPYPDILFVRLRERFGLDGTGRLLDLGCGTGQMALPLAGSFEQVIAMDPEPEMLAHGASAAGRLHIINLRWIEGSSEDLGPHLGSFRLVTMGRSFHWMDQEVTLRTLSGMIEPGGGLVVIDTSSDSAANAWQQAVKKVMRRWLGDTRRAGSATQERHEAVIARSPFARMEVYRLRYQRAWSIESIIGYVRSLSFASIEVLGGRQQAFEADLRRALLRMAPAGHFVEDVELGAILAWKP